LLVAIALFPVHTSAASSKDPWRNYTNIAMGCSAVISLQDDTNEKEESENIKTPREDDSSLRKKTSKVRTGSQAMSIPSGEFTKTINYGKTTALMDLLFMSTFVGAIVADQNSVVVSAAGIAYWRYFFAAPITHTYFGELGSALISIATRWGLPVLGGFVGFTLSPPDSDTYILDMGEGFMLGTLSGVATAAVIDALFLAETTITINEGPSLSAIPSLSVTPKGTFTFGLAGHFCSLG